MITLPSGRRTSACPVVFLLLVALAFAGCASVGGYQKAEAQYDRESERNRDLAQQYSQEISALNARQAAYRQTLADEARLANENARLQQRIATLQAAPNSAPPAPATAPSSGFQELGQSITAQTYGVMQQELRDYGRLESLYDGQLKALSSYGTASPEYRKEAEIARAQALLDVVSEALVTVDVPRGVLRASLLVDDSRSEQALTALVDAQDRMIVALNDFKLRGRDQSSGSCASAQARCGDLLAAITDVTGSLKRSPSGKDLIARLEALRGITEVAGALLTTTQALLNSPAPPPGRLPVAQSLKAYGPVAQLISSSMAARDISGARMTGQPTSSQIRFLNRMEWIMTMGSYCQAESFKPESYIQMRLGEVHPLKAAVLEIVDSYERNHRGNDRGGKDAVPLGPAQEPNARTEEPFLNSFGP